MPNLNVRISEEQSEKLKRTVEDISKRIPEGCEVSNSTVVRTAIDNFIKERDLFKMTFNLNDFSKGELDALYRLVIKMHDMIPQVPEVHPNFKVFDLMEDNLINLMKSISNLQIEKGFLNKNGTLKK